MKNILNSRLQRFLGSACTLSLPQHLKEILVGLLLGDASIKLNKSEINCYVTFEQSLKHKEYLLYLYQLFESYAHKEPTEYKRFDKRHNKENISLFFRTRSSASFNELAYSFLSRDIGASPKKSDCSGRNL